jgi:hypothetical protein
MRAREVPNSSLVFVYHCEGVSYLPFLTVSLASAFEHHPTSVAQVSLVNVPGFEVEILKARFTRASFIISERKQQLPLELRIASKPNQWSRASEEIPEDKICVFLDADTIVTGNIEECLPASFDVIFTHKEERWPVNSGVLIGRKSSELREFLQTWSRTTHEITSEPKRLSHAREVAGAADQLALLEIISDAWQGNSSWREGARRNVGGAEVQLVGMPCEILNNTNSVGSDLNGTRIIHVKRWMQKMIEEDGAPNEVRNGFEAEMTFARWEQEYLRTSRTAISLWMAQEVNKQETSWIGNLSQEPVEARGILNSEMHAVLCVSKRMGISTILESGVARGQSTRILNKYLPSVRKISIEIENSTDFEFARLQTPSSKFQTYIVADSAKWLPKNISSVEGPAIVVIDGPKGTDALRLAEDVVRHDERGIVAAIFLHDVHELTRGRRNPIRALLSISFDRVWFSDDERWLEKYSQLDDESGHIPGKKDLWELGSYGPTIAAVFPTSRDRNMLRRHSRLETYLGNSRKSPKQLLKKTLKRLLG